MDRDPLFSSHEQTLAEADKRREIDYAASERWVRIGRWCSARRRSLWVRLILDRKGEGFTYRDSVKAIEFIAGREGRDDAARIERGSQDFCQLLDVILCQIYAVELLEDEGVGAAKRCREHLFKAFGGVENVDAEMHIHEAIGELATLEKSECDPYEDAIEPLRKP